MTHPRVTHRVSPLTNSLLGRWSLIGWLVCLILLLTEQWVLGPALFVLLLGWHLLARSGGPPVVPAALTYQWVQVSVAVFYLQVTGRAVWDLEGIDVQRIVMFGLAAIAVFFGGYAVVSGTTKQGSALSQTSTRVAPLTLIAISYVIAVAINMPLQRTAWALPFLTQFLLMLSFTRYCLLFILITRLLKPHPRWTLVIAVCAAELLIGFTGFYATFRESLVFIALAILTVADRRRASTWVIGIFFGAVAFGAALTWTVIKPAVRVEYSSSASAGQRLQNVAGALAPALRNSASRWGSQVDRLVSRLWMMRFPALALERVPKLLPHENGKLLAGAVSNTLMPRIFFPEKGEIPSSSDNVRKYAGINVAGRSRGTSHAFGYAAESYVDFGWPWMLVPIFVWGSILGLGDRLVRGTLRNPDIHDGVRVVFLWCSMYLYEVSWVIMIGTTVSLLVALLGAGFLFERAFSLGKPEDSTGAALRTIRSPAARRRPHISTAARIPYD